MSCQEFEEVILDVVRGQMMDATVRDRAIAHGASCGRCGSRLADERALTARLRRVAEASAEAPPHVQAKLCEAFRAQVPAPAASRGSHRRSARGAVAAAAMVLLLALVALTASRLSNEPVGKEQAQSGVPAEQPPAHSSDNAQEQVRPMLATKPVSRQGASRRVRRARPTSETTQMVPGVRTEIATEFIPLIHGEDLARQDGAQLVRIEMPRSALTSFGLPVNVERADELIKADVVFGNDGLARAIRFVR